MQNRKNCQRKDLVNMKANDDEALRIEAVKLLIPRNGTKENVV